MLVERRDFGADIESGVLSRFNLDAAAYILPGLRKILQRSSFSSSSLLMRLLRVLKRSSVGGSKGTSGIG